MRPEAVGELVTNERERPTRAAPMTDAIETASRTVPMEMDVPHESSRRRASTDIRTAES